MFKVEVNTFSCASDAWTGNGLQFDTREDAEAYASDLADRWTAVRWTRVVEDDGKDPIAA